MAGIHKRKAEILNELKYFQKQVSAMKAILNAPAVTHEEKESAEYRLRNFQSCIRDGEAELKSIEEILNKPLKG